MTQPPTDELRLVPCPFCGGDVINTRSQEMTKGPAYYWHKCETCGAESEGDYGEDVAVAAWNRRAAPASPLPGGGDMDWQSVAMWMGFAASVIKSGEPWSDQRQQHYDEAKAAFARLAAPTGAA